MKKITIADEKGVMFWKSWAMMQRGCVLAATGEPLEAVDAISSGVAAFRSTGSTMWVPFYLSYQARAHADLERFDDAWRCIGEAAEAVEKTKERWCEAEICGIAGEISFCRRTRIRQRQKNISNAPLRSHANSKRSLGNYAQR
jgi:hypothetical protein